MNVEIKEIIEDVYEVRIETVDPDLMGLAIRAEAAAEQAEESAASANESSISAGQSATVATESANEALNSANYANSEADRAQLEADSVDQKLIDKEDKINKVNTISYPNDVEYPTTKAVSDAVGAITISSIGAISIAEKGAAGGVPALDDNQLIRPENLPSYVDDVLEGILINDTTFNNSEDEPYIPEGSKIYVDISETPNKGSWRWSGSVYTKVESGGVALGETSSTAYRGDRGKIAYDHSLMEGNPHNTNISNIPNLSSELANRVPYTGATQDININTKKLTTGGEIRKLAANFDVVNLSNDGTASVHLRQINNVASLSIANSSTPGDIVITLPIITSTNWWMEVDIFDNSKTSKLLIRAYDTSNTARAVIDLGSTPEFISEVKFGRKDGNTVLIIKRSTGTSSFVYGKVNINSFYHSVSYHAGLGVKGNYKVEFLDEANLTGFSLQGTIKVEVKVPLVASSYYLSSLSTAPASASASGTIGEIRITEDYIYICIATDTWVRSSLTTW